jgi:diacylglycerol kinase (ATP)
MDPHLLFEPSAARYLDEITDKLDEIGVRFTSEVAQDVEATARARVDEGSLFLVVVGDDVTLGSAVRGMMTRVGPRVEGNAVGILPTGACGVARTFGIPLDPVRACRHLAGDAFFDLDVGVVTCRGPGGEAWAPFVALAEVGFGARKVAVEARLPALLGRARPFMAFWGGLASSGGRVSVEAGRRSYEGDAWDVVVGNCQFLGDLRLSPRSFPGDGILDVLVMTGTRSAAFRRLPEMTRGDHVPDDSVIELKGGTAAVDSRRAVPVHADGMFVGTTPAAFDVLPQALRLKV